MRQILASALDAVSDVRGHAKRPFTLAEGDAWPVLGPLDRASGTAFLVTWIDEHWADLFYALAPHGHVQRGVPTMLAASPADLYALEITLIAEE